MTAIRWSDNDRYFGPFTFARETYTRFALVLGSGDDDDYPGCRLRISAFGRTVIVALPPIIKPWREKVIAHWDAATIARLGRDWYWNAFEREYGISYAEGALHVRYGRQTHDSTTDKSKCYFLPWTQWRHVRHSLYDLAGEHFWTFPESRRPRLNAWLAEAAVEEACPSVSFEFEDFDGERITATTRIEEREWHFGTKWCKWLSLFRRPKIRRSLNISFSAETGRRKGSWKGGAIGTGVDMLPSELHEEAFRRYCDQNGMVFIGKPTAA